MKSRSLCRFLLVLGILFWSSSYGAGTENLAFHVTHSPQQPSSGQPVTVTARIAGSTPSENVVLQIQVVEPGLYLRKSDAGYRTNWRDYPMDETKEGFAVTIPGDLQKHRRLV